MTEIKLTKRYPHSRTEDITDAFMRGYEQGKKDGLKVGKQIVLGAFETYITADRKTEPKPQSLLEAYFKMRAEEAEPQTEVETMSCAECKHRPIGAEICEEPCHYEPQTDWHYDEQDATWYPYKHEDEPQAIRALPSEDRPQGEWIDEADKYDASFGIHDYRCSNCNSYADEYIGGHEWYTAGKPNFCPYCGADMREREGE